LESHIGARDEEIQSLRLSLRKSEQRLADAEEKKLKSTSHSQADACKVEVPVGEGSASEITKIRIKLAETERANRQLTRKVAESEKKVREVVQHREVAKAAKSKAERLEEEMKALRREREEGRVLETQWAEFRFEIEKSFGKEKTGEEKRISPTSMSQPPEIATVVRHFNKIKQKCLHLEEHSSSIQSQLESSQRRVAALENQMATQRKELDLWQSEKKEMEHRVTASDTELGKIRAQEKIWQREADSLRSLLSTYENVHESSSGGSEKKKRRVAPAESSTASRNEKEGDEDGPTSQGLRLSLDSARERVDILTQQNNTATEELESSRSEIEKLKAEHERVLEKFSKLRDALYKEREKAAEAEDRACQAETLAGKGSFNSETTRVLHLQENPMMAAVREKYETEIRALKEAIEEMKAESSAKGSTSTKTPPSGKKDTISSLDAQKLHQRLKQSFKEQIAMFREGVYLLTGYKVDMFVDSDRPRYKVRSMFSEQEDDHLMFVWPKTKPGEDEGVTSLDMLDTELAQQLSKTSSSIQYITKFKSLPAFMSSVTLELFEKQTFMG